MNKKSNNRNGKINNKSNNSSGRTNNKRNNRTLRLEFGSEARERFRAWRL